MGILPDKVYNIVFDLLPMVILFSVVMILIRIITSFYVKEKIVFYREIKALIYIIYTFALFKLITTSDFSSYSNNFILFKEIMRYDVTSSLFYRNVIGNILLFIPFGYMITDMIRVKAGKCNIFIAMLVTLVTSLSTEIIQMFIGRSFDIDDIFLNLIGGTTGFLLYYIFHYIYRKLPEKFHNNGFKLFCYLGICIIFVIVFLIFYTMR